MRFLTALFLMLLAAAPFATSAAAADGKIYAVVFEVTADADGKVATLEVSKVIDPASGNADAVDVDVPQVYIDAVRASLADRTYRDAPTPFYTYTFFDPAQPERADIDPTAGRR